MLSCFYFNVNRERGSSALNLHELMPWIKPQTDQSPERLREFFDELVAKTKKDQADGDQAT